MNIKHTIAATLALCGLLSPGEALSQSDSDRADKLLEEGIALGRVRDWSGARDKMRQAWALKKSYDIAGNLGLIEAEIEDWRASAEHLDYARKMFPLNGKPESRVRIDQVMAEAKGKVACVKIVVDVDGSRVKFGDRELGSSPIQDLACAYPRPLTISVTRDGYQPAAEALDLAMGSERTVPFKLVPAKGTKVEDDAARPAWPAFVLGGVALAGIGVGIGLTVTGNGKYSEADDACADSSSACVATEQGLLDEAGTLSTGGIVSFGVGGAALLGTLLYTFLPGGPGNPQTSASAFRIVPALGPGSGGLTFTTTF